VPMLSLPFNHEPEKTIHLLRSEDKSLTPEGKASQSPMECEVRLNPASSKKSLMQSTPTKRICVHCDKDHCSGD
jgi:hypothetical protein